MTMPPGEQPSVGAMVALEHAKRHLGREVESRSFTGSLAELALPDVLQLLESLRKTGSLHLSGPGGLVFFALEQGRIIGCDDGFTPRGRLAERATALVGEVLGWGAGTFTFVAAKEADHRPEGEPLLPTGVVLEALRLADELAARSAPTPDGDDEPLARAGANDDTPKDPPAALPPPAAPRRRGVVLVLALCVTALAAGSVGYLLASRPASPPPRREAPQPAPPQPEVSTLGAALQRARQAATDDDGVSPTDEPAAGPARTEQPAAPGRAP